MNIHLNLTLLSTIGCIAGGLVTAGCGVGGVMEAHELGKPTQALGAAFIAIVGFLIVLIGVASL